MPTNEQHLLEIFRCLPEEDKNALLKFAAFLQSAEKTESITDRKAEKPKLLSAGNNESVVGALKRLSESYPMLEKSKMLDETSQLMSQHIMMGRDKKEVILELEQLFQNRYEEFRIKSETQ